MRVARLASLLAASCFIAASYFATPDALACGCMAPPDPMTSVVQAAEKILFSTTGNTVTAIIQIQYQGAAKDFGWLIPLPSVPTLEVSSDEVFTGLVQGTQPSYSLSTAYPNGVLWR